jgi:hypothetical protein
MNVMRLIDFCVTQGEQVTIRKVEIDGGGRLAHRFTLLNRLRDRIRIALSLYEMTPLLTPLRIITGARRLSGKNTGGINMCWSRYIVSVIASVCVCACVSAQSQLSQDRIDEIHRASQTPIDGAKTPDRVPYHLRMGMFFDLYPHHAGELRSLLTAEDLNILAAYAESLRRAARRSIENPNDPMQDPLMQIASRAQSMTGVQLATELQAARAREDARQAADFRRVIGSLSQNGQKTVTEFAFTKVRPKLVLNDPTVIAQAEPEWYKFQIMGAYELVLSGRADEDAPTSSEPITRSMVPAESSSSEVRLGVSHGGTPEQ